MDLKQISEMVAAVCSSRTVTELAIREGSGRLVIRRSLAVIPPDEETPPVENVEPEPATVTVRSPLVGVFHASTSPKHPPVGVGTWVEEGQTIGAIESMRMLYDVNADVSGVIAEVLVEDGQPVEYGQDLFRVRPSTDPTRGAE